MHAYVRAPRRFLSLAFAVAILAAPALWAQQPASIQQQMTTEQFRAAGLDRLDAAQLANLDEWLNRTLVSETAKAAKTAEAKVNHQNRGFLGSGAREPVEARLQGKFAGFSIGRSYTLDNGQIWRQTDSASLHGVHLDNPKIKITPSLVGGAWYMQVEGYGTRAKVQRSE